VPAGRAAHRSPGAARRAAPSPAGFPAPVT
jgi:hypothetical protein